MNLSLFGEVISIALEKKSVISVDPLAAMKSESLKVWFSVGIILLLLVIITGIAYISSPERKEKPVDGGFSSWGNWSPCPVTCGGGSQFRQRSCNSPTPRHNGKGCKGDQTEYQKCSTHICPTVNSNWGDWGLWENCTGPCGRGFQNRSRTCDAQAIGEYACPGPDMQTRECSAPCHECPPDWLRLPDSNKCVRKMAELLTFNKALERCKSLRPDSNLLSIHSDAQHEFLKDVYLDGEEPVGVWIGLHDLEAEGILTWTDATPVNYVKFLPTRPDGGRKENCVLLSKPHEFLWNDIVCNIQMPPLCQTCTLTGSCQMHEVNDWDVCGETCPGESETRIQKCNAGIGICTPQSVLKEKCNSYQCPECPPSWVKLPGSNKCVVKNYNSLPFVDALKICQSWRADGSLVSIHTEAEHDFLINMFAGNESSDVWIGLHDKGTEGQLQWTDGAIVGYTNFHDTQPEGGRSDNCMQLSKARGFLWNDIACNTKMPSICQTCALTESCEDNGIWSEWDGWDDWVECGATCPGERETRIQNCKAGKAKCALQRDPGERCQSYQCPECPPGWIKMPDRLRCVKRNHDYFTYNKALKTCQSWRADGSLVSVHTNQEHDFLANLIAGNDAFGVWMGLDGRGNKSELRWTDGTMLEYTNFHPTKPDGVENEKCIHFSRTLKFLWDDNICNTKMPSICQTCALTEHCRLNTLWSEWDAWDDWVQCGAACPGESETRIQACSSPVSDDEACLSSTVQSEQCQEYQCPECPPGWLKLPDSTKCIKKIEESMSFDHALERCQSLRSGGSLVSVHSEEQNEFLKAVFAGSHYALWIGLNDRETEGQFKWTDDTAVNFMNFPSREPNGATNENCICFYEHYGHMWSDFPCSFQMIFICQAASLH